MKSQLFFSITLTLGLGASCTSNTVSSSQSSGSTAGGALVSDDTGAAFALIDPIDAASAEPAADRVIVDGAVTAMTAIETIETTDASVAATPLADAGRARPSTTRPTTRPSSTASTAPSTTPATNPAAAEGQVIFDRTCGRCHPGGNARIGPRLAARADTEAHVRTVVRNGEGTMRPIPSSRVSDGDLVKVFAFLRSIRAVR